MLLEIFGFLHMSLADMLDILLVALIIYLSFRWIKGSSAMNIFLVIFFLFVFRVVAESLNMKLMTAILKTVLDVGVLALIIIFQPEIRHFIIKVTVRSSFYGRWRTVLNKFLGMEESTFMDHGADEIAEACMVMGQNKTGALIVIPGNSPLEQIIGTGDRIDAIVSRRLIMNIFFKNSPLHDGAMIINSNRIVAARCTLPITSRTDIPAHYGMRHKAAIGITEESDASVVVVSEETGQISFIRTGVITGIENINELKLLLGPALNRTSTARKEE